MKIFKCFCVSKSRLRMHRTLEEKEREEKVKERKEKGCAEEAAETILVSRCDGSVHLRS